MSQGFGWIVQKPALHRNFLGNLGMGIMGILEKTIKNNSSCGFVGDPFVKPLMAFPYFCFTNGFGINDPNHVMGVGGGG